MLNRLRGEVAIGRSGGDTSISFTVDAMERLQSRYGSDWLNTIFEGLDSYRPTIIRACLEAAAGGSPVDITDLWHFEGVRAAIYDGLFLALHGKTVAEAQSKAEQQGETAASSRPQNTSLVANLWKIGHRAGFRPGEVRTMTPFEIVEYARDRGESDWEQIVRGAWLAARLVTIGAHAPKEFPRSPDVLLPPKEVAVAKPAQTPQQWAAFFSYVLEKPVHIKGDRM